MTKYTSEIFLTVDAVVFGQGRDGKTSLLLIQRKNDPFKGKWALPGGFVEKDEDLETAAKRELQEETGLKVGKVEQLGTFGRPGRDPRGRMVSVAYLAHVDLEQAKITAGDDAGDAQWFAIDALPELAFDHKEIIELAIKQNTTRSSQPLTNVILSGVEVHNQLTFTKVKETCIYITDLKRTRAFYEGKLGLECLNEVEGRHIFFRAGTSVLLGFIAEATKNDTSLPPHFGYGQQHFAFECRKEDYDAWRKKIVDSGITILQDVEWPRGGRSFYFHDPDTNLAEIVEPGIWEW